ncbi:ATP-binding protein [bacterium]|nr:ATP-binding protein [bacterium]
MINRTILKDLQEALAVFPVVLLCGARQVGKSTLVLSLCEHYITLDDITQLDGARADPKRFIQDLPRPIVIDEIQKAPELLPAIKEEVDRKRKNGDFLLTGSANLLGYKKVTESLAGRMGVMELLPLSCREMANRADANLADDLFSAEWPNNKTPQSGNLLLDSLLQGGYPELQKIHTQRGRNLWFSSYVSTYIERDVRDIGELRHIDRFIHLLNILAPRSATLLNKAELSRTAGIEQKTLTNYLSLLEMVFQIKRIQPYSTNLGKRFVKSPKLFFTDSGVLCHLLGLNSKETLRNSSHYGAILETFVFTELLKAVQYSESPTRLWHYRTSDQHEIDLLIERDGKVIPVEIKAAKTVRKKDFKHIEDLQSRNSTVKNGVIFYQGEQLVPFGKNYAMPIPMLF